MNDLFKKQQEELKSKTTTNGFVKTNYLMTNNEALDFLSLCQEQWREFVVEKTSEQIIKTKDNPEKVNVDERVKKETKFTVLSDEEIAYNFALSDLREIFNIKE